MPNNANHVLEAVFARNAFYKRMHYLVLSTFFLCLFVIGFLIWVLYYLINNPDEPVYFATDSIARLIPIVPTDRPNMSNEKVIEWTSNALESALSYDFINYRYQFQNTQKYFTDYGWRNFWAAFQLSNNLPALLQRRQVVVAKVIPPVKILTQGMLAGSFAWKFEIPILTTFWQPPFDKPAFTNALIYTVIVQRQPVLQSDNGLGILQLIGRYAQAQHQVPQISTTPTG